MINSISVIPAQAGIQNYQEPGCPLEFILAKAGTGATNKSEAPLP